MTKFKVNDIVRIIKKPSVNQHIQSSNDKLTEEMNTPINKRVKYYLDFFEIWLITNP
jgi:phage terminase small subunit